MNPGAHTGIVAILFADIEGSTRLWEELPGRMRPALAPHDALPCAALGSRRGIVAKMTGDGLHAAFTDASRSGGGDARIAAGTVRSDGDCRGAPAASLRNPCRAGRAPRRAEGHAMRTSGLDQVRTP
jgi:class 3 adenylate cyclase